MNHFRDFFLFLLLFVCFLPHTTSSGSNLNPNLELSSNLTSNKEPATLTTSSTTTVTSLRNEDDDEEEEKEARGNGKSSELESSSRSAVEEKDVIYPSESTNEDEKTLKRAVDMIEKGVIATVENIKPLIKKDSLGTGEGNDSRGDGDKEGEDEGEDDDEEESDEESKDDNPVKEAISYSPVTRNANETIQVLQKLSKMVSTGIEGLFRESIPLVATLGYDSDLSSECLGSLLKLFNGVRKQETWAWRRK